MFLDALVVQSTVETLTMHGRRWFSSLRLNRGLACSFSLCEYFIAIEFSKILHPSTWPRLQTLVLKRQFSHFSVHATIETLKDFPLSTLKDITVELPCSSIQDVNYELLHKPSLGLELEQTLLRFPRPNVTIFVNHLRFGRSSFWTQEIGKDYFPVLLQRGAFKVICWTGACLISQFC